MFASVLAVSLGAALGALLRWGLGAGLNAVWPAVPPGTLAANLIGGYLIGVALIWFGQHAALPEAWRLFVITGFLGGLTTFSTFSAEVMKHLVEGRIGAAGLVVVLHVAGSLLATWAGLASAARWWKA